MNGSAQRRPWPMKWVIVVILVFIAGYSWVMIKYRKPGPAYRPYQDSVDRATVTRLLGSGYQRITLGVEHPADPGTGAVLNGSAAATLEKTSGGLPAELAAILTEKPLLADSIQRITTPASVPALLPLRILFTASQSDDRQTITEGSLYRKGDELIILPRFERIGGGLQTRWKETTLVLSIPAGALPSGNYRVCLVARKNSYRWSCTLRP